MLNGMQGEVSRSQPSTSRCPTQAHIPANSIDAHNKGVVLRDRVEKNDQRAVAEILGTLTSTDKQNSNFLKELDAACHHALATNKIDIFYMLLPFADINTTDGLLAAAVNMQLLRVMPSLLAKAEKISQTIEPSEKIKLISHETQANYLERILQQNRRILSFIYSQAQAHKNQAIMQLFENEDNFYPKRPLEIQPPVIFSSAITGLTRTHEEAFSVPRSEPVAVTKEGAEKNERDERPQKKRAT